METHAWRPLFFAQTLQPRKPHWSSDYVSLSRESALLVRLSWRYFRMLPWYRRVASSYLKITSRDRLVWTLPEPPWLLSRKNWGYPQLQHFIRFRTPSVLGFSRGTEPIVCTCISLCLSMYIHLQWWRLRNPRPAVGRSGAQESRSVIPG